MADVVQDQDLHRIVLTAIIYNDEKKYLIIKRAPSKKVLPGKWSVPGGGVEADDYRDTKPTVEDAWYNVVEKTLIREVKEEVNVEIEKPQYLLDVIFVRPDGIPVLVLSYYARYKRGDVTLEKDEFTDFAWVTCQEAKKYDLVAGLWDEIKQVDTCLCRQAILKR